MLSLKLQIWRLLRAKCSLTIRQTIECGFTLNLVRDMINTNTVSNFYSSISTNTVHNLVMVNIENHYCMDFKNLILKPIEKFFTADDMINYQTDNSFFISNVFSQRSFKCRLGVSWYIQASSYWDTFLFTIFVSMSRPTPVFAASMWSVFRFHPRFHYD